MERSIYTLSIVKLKGLREYIHESSTFPKFFSSSFIQDGIRRYSRYSMYCKECRDSLY